MNVEMVKKIRILCVSWVKSPVKTIFFFAKYVYTYVLYKYDYSTDGIPPAGFIIHPASHSRAYNGYSLSYCI